MLLVHTLAPLLAAATLQQAALQHEAAGSLAPQRPESTAVIRAARSAQARFERFRRGRLPQRPSGAPDRCDATIGRFCYWHSPNENPPPEPPEIGRERQRFIASLDSLAALSPRDGWITGERIRYLVEDGRHDDAIAAARSCQAGEHWCAAVLGFALHAAGDFGPADSAFAAAIAAMDEDERCRWTDASILLDGALRERYERAGCAGRPELEAQLWWLAKPLQMLPGNDLRSGYYARLVMGAMQERTRSPHGMMWSKDLREMMLRFGWSTSWTRSTPSPGSLNQPSVSGHEPSPSYWFFPTDRTLERPDEAGPDAWQTDTPRPRSRYAPEYASPFLPLEHVSAVFRRGDSLFVAARYVVKPDTLFTHESQLEAGLVLSDGTGREAPAIARLERAPLSGVLSVTAPGDARLLSLELVDRERSVAARARYGLAPRLDAGSPELSDLLLIDADGDLPASVEEALPRMLGSTRVSPSQLGLVWEYYGLAEPGLPVTVSLRAIRESGWGRRAAEWLRLRDRQLPVRLRWQQPLSATEGVATGALYLDATDFEPGEYRLELTVTPAGGKPVSVSRQIEVLKR